MLAIVSSVLLRFMPSHYPFGIFWPLYRLSYFDLCLLIISSVSFGHCIVCPSSIYAFWLPLWYLVAIVSSVLLRLMASDYLFGIIWPLYRLSYFDLCLLIIPLVSFGHCIVCPTLIYAFWLSLRYLLAIVSSVLLRLMPSDYPFGILWPLYRLSYFDLCLLITPLVSFGHCIVCPTLICASWLPLWYLLAIVSSVLLWFMPSDYHFGIFCPLYRLSYFDLCLLIAPLVSFGHCIVTIVSFVLLWFVPSDYPLLYVGHCIVCPTCPTSLYRLSYFDLIHLLLAILSSVLLWFMPSDYLFGIFWPLYRLAFFDLCLLITPWYLLTIVSFVLLWFVPSDYPLLYVGHCIVCPTSINAFWLALWYCLAIVYSVLLQLMPSDYPLVICWPLYRLYLLRFMPSHYLCYMLAFCIFWPFYRLSYFDLCLLIISSVIFWPLYRLSFFDWCLLITPLYLLTIVLSVLLWFMPSDYPFGMFWPLYRLSYFDLCLLIIPLGIFGHCIVCPSSIDAFWLPLWYLVAIVSSVLLWFMPSDYPFGIFWPLYRLSYLRLMPSDYPFVICWPLYRLSYFDLCLLIWPL